MSVCLASWMSVCLSVHPSVHPFICLSFHLSVHPSICSSICLSIHPFVCLPVCLSVHPSIHSSSYLLIDLSISIPPLSLYLLSHAHIDIDIYAWIPKCTGCQKKKNWNWKTHTHTHTRTHISGKIIGDMHTALKLPSLKLYIYVGDIYGSIVKVTSFRWGIKCTLYHFQVTSDHFILLHIPYIKIYLYLNP